MKIIVAITARASYSRIQSALKFLQVYKHVDLRILCSGSTLLDRYGRVIDLIRHDGFTVMDGLHTLVEGNDPICMALTTGQTLQSTAFLLQREQPDWVITIADRHETLGTAVAASYLGIPLIHVQGGELTGNIDERVRHAISKLSDIHLVAHDKAAARLEAMGETPESIFVTGCPSIDLAREALELPMDHVADAVTQQGIGSHLDVTGNYIVVLQHSDTTIYRSSYDHMIMTLTESRKLGLPMFIFQPNSDAGSDATAKAIKDFTRTTGLENIRIITHLEGRVFLRLLSRARCLVGNSSVGVRECAFLGTPVVNLGDRQMGRDRAPNVLDCHWSPPALARALQHQIIRRFSPSTLYGDGHSGQAMARVISALPSSSLQHQEQIRQPYVSHQ